MQQLSRRGLLAATGAVTFLAACGKEEGTGAGVAPLSLLNVSYDPTRELYREVNAAFAKKWAADNKGQAVTIEQSHGGSGSQARAVIDGL